MKAGFARVSITPPLGTRMLGWGTRDSASGCKSIHDPIFVRALYLEEGGERAVILSYDLCFVGRSESDQLKGALGRDMDLTPRQIMISATHNHAGPALGAWNGALPNTEYMSDVERATRQAAHQAKASARGVSVHAGAGKSKLPVSRRKMINGVVENLPNPDGAVCDALPVCELIDESGMVVCLLFSCSTHPVIFSGWDISAEYPGNACDKLDQRIGHACSLFLQGCAGDSRPSTVNLGDQWNWSATYAEVEAAGAILARETAGVLDAGLKQRPACLRTALVETHWPLTPRPGKQVLQAAIDNPETTAEAELKRIWARRQMRMLNHRGTLADTCPVLVQAIQIGQDVRLIAIEGEPVADHGLHILRFFKDGVSFPLGYANGEAAYLPSSRMLPEGGYEVHSFWEYGHPSQLDAGMEGILEKTFEGFRKMGM